jgi:uncharacterized membrane protein
VSQYRGLTAVILAFMLGLLLIILAIAVIMGVHIAETTRMAGVAAIGVLVGALATYLAKQS